MLTQTHQPYGDRSWHAHFAFRQLWTTL